LEQLGADHIKNYHETPNWGEQAKALTSDRTGVQHIIEVGGPATIAQSPKAVAIDGVISIIGFIGGSSKEQPTFLDCLSNLCTVRGLLVGSRMQFEDMNKAIEANNIHPVVDKQEFCLEQLKEAYQFMFDQKNLGKVTINIA
jgi:NADPH:quinone reductase-like Zn-dependent oxidoreductase